MRVFLMMMMVFLSFNVSAKNESNQSFSKSKKMLETKVYFDNRETVYCGAKFDEKKIVTAPDGFASDKYKKRAKKIEWEHIVAAENFGRNFSEWRDGDNSCVDNKGKSFKGRKCAEKVNIEYRYMQADMFNLFPAIGSVNALRSNYNFVMLNGEESSFGSCDMVISNKKAQPPENARGVIARAHLYMESSYQKFKMSKQQSQLMNAWDKQYPVTAWECKRNKRIESLQKSSNDVVSSRCSIAGL